MSGRLPDYQYQAHSCRVQLNKRGEKNYTKASYPVRTGIYSELNGDEFIYHFNLNNEIVRIIGKTADWPHPHEWLKRTAGNEWIYYSTGGYTGVYETTGEYYLPNLPYSTNNALGGTPLENDHIRSAINNWYPILNELQTTLCSPPSACTTIYKSPLSQ